jgi:predicted ATPase/DNA-binding CsgD family transcriptional regulator
MDHPFLNTQGPDLIGRKQELAHVLSLFDIISTGQVTVLMLSGEPGIGKTRFMAEVGVRACERDGQCLFGTAIEAEGMPPYLPLLQALRSHIVSTPRDQLQAQLGSNADTLAGILPEIHAKLDQIPPGLPLPIDQARLRLYDAVADFIFEITRTAPLLLGLDDLDQADPASLELICHIVRRQPNARLLLLGSYREGGITHILAFDRAMAELSRLRRLERMTLDPLELDEMNSFASQLLQAPVSSDLANHLFTHSEGNPFFAEELMRDWVEAGVVNLSDPELETLTWSLRGPLPGQIPRNIVSAIRQRLSRLPGAVVDQLRVASVIGPSFTLKLLEQISGIDSLRLCDLMQVSEEARLIRWLSDEEYAFSHAKIRECLYSEVSSARQHALHEKIGRALEEEMRTNGVDMNAEIAFHYVRSNDHKRGAEFSRRAAESALRSYAIERALDHYENVIKLVGTASPEYGEVLLKLANVYLQSGDASRAQSIFQAAEVWYRERGDSLHSARARHGLGKAFWHLDELSLAEEAFKHALERFDSIQAVKDAIQVQVDAAELTGFVLGRGEDGIELSRRALEMARRAEDQDLEISSSRVHGFLQVLENNLEEGVEMLENSLQMAKERGNLREAAECCAALAQAYVWSADFDRSHQVSLQREEFARSGHIPDSLAYVYSWLAFLSAARGDWHKTLQYIGSAEIEVQTLPSSRPIAFLHQIKGFHALQQGDYVLAEKEFYSALGIFREKDPMEYILSIGLLGITHCYLGKGELARRALEEQDEILLNTRISKLPAASVKSTLCLTLSLLGARERELKHDSDLLDCRGQHHWFLVDRILGIMAVGRADWKAAAQCFSQAEAQARRESLQPELARTYLAMADLELARGGAGSADQARIFLGKALGIFRALDHKSGIKLARAKIGDLPPQPLSSRSGHRPGSLSSREHDVLRLLAGGRSNREIAQELTLSESTVAKHLTSIYTKLGVENRSAAIAVAIRRGLD